MDANTYVTVKIEANNSQKQTLVPLTRHNSFLRNFTLLLNQLSLAKFLFKYLLAMICFTVNIDFNL